MTKSNIVGVLATPGTVSREYTHSLVKTYAANCRVILHGATRLADLAERRLRGEALSREALLNEISPVFVQEGDRRTDVVVLGCTHYPLLVEDIKAIAPWSVTYLDPAPAIARRVEFVVQEMGERQSAPSPVKHGTVILTSLQARTAELKIAYENMGFPVLESLDIPV